MTAAEEQAFASQLAALHSIVLGVTRKLCGDAQMAEDLTQDAMLRAWSARERFQPGTNMRAWLCVIARNIFLSAKRRERFSGGYVDDLAVSLLPSTGPTQEQPIHFADTVAALGRLPKLQAEALIAVAGGASYEDVSEETGAPLGTIKSRVARGRAAIIADLKGNRRPQPTTVVTAAPEPIAVAPAVIVIAEPQPAPERKRPGRKVAIPAAAPGTSLERVCELVALNGVRGTAALLEVDPSAVSVAMTRAAVPPVLQRAVDRFAAMELAA